MKLAVIAFVLAGPPGLPDDARLTAVRPRLEAVVQAAENERLPSELLVTKVREGLAKGVDAARIESAVARLFDSLRASRAFLAERRGRAPSPDLLRAATQAQMAGLEPGATDEIIRGRASDAHTARALDVLTDLSSRGYSAKRAAPVVREVMTRDAPAIERVQAALETMRKDQTLSHAEAVDALARGLAGAPSLQAASTRALDDERRKGAAGKNTRGHGAESTALDGPGKSDLAPGRLKARGPAGNVDKKK